MLAITNIPRDIQQSDKSSKYSYQPVVVFSWLLPIWDTNVTRISSSVTLPARVHACRMPSVQIRAWPLLSVGRDQVTDCNSYRQSLNSSHLCWKTFVESCYSSSPVRLGKQSLTDCSTHRKSTKTTKQCRSTWMLMMRSPTWSGESQAGCSLTHCL